MEPPKECPKGHGPLRRDDREGIAVCLTCGYEEPLEEQPLEELPAEELPAEDPEPKGYEPKGGKAVRGKAVRGSQGFRYPEDTKILAVREVEGGADKEEVCKRVGCAHITLVEWCAKYGKKHRDADNLEALDEMLTELKRRRFFLDRLISGTETAIKILEEK